VRGKYRSHRPYFGNAFGNALVWFVFVSSVLRDTILSGLVPCSAVQFSKTGHLYYKKYSIDTIESCPESTPKGKRSQIYC